MSGDEFPGFAPGPAHDATFEIAVRDAAAQEVAIEVAGEDVMYLPGRGGDPADDMQMPDWVALLAAAVNLGMCGGAAHAPWASRAQVLENAFDPRARRNRWRVALEGVDAGVFRVLDTLLRARALDQVTIRTLAAPAGAPLLRLHQVAYPGRYAELPFPVEQAEVMRERRGRAVEVEFAQAPSEQTYARGVAALGVWGDLLVLGAYARPDLHPRNAQTLPEHPRMADAVTLAQTFDEAFDADTAAFDAVVNWAARVHHDGAAVRAVRLR